MLNLLMGGRFPRHRLNSTKTSMLQKFKLFCLSRKSQQAKMKTTEIAFELQAFNIKSGEPQLSGGVYMIPHRLAAGTLSMAANSSNKPKPDVDHHNRTPCFCANPLFERNSSNGSNHSGKIGTMIGLEFDPSLKNTETEITEFETPKTPKTPEGFLQQGYHDYLSTMKSIEENQETPKVIASKSTTINIAQGFQFELIVAANSEHLKNNTENNTETSETSEINSENNIEKYTVALNMHPEIKKLINQSFIKQVITALEKLAPQSANLSNIPYSAYFSSDEIQAVKTALKKISDANDSEHKKSINQSKRQSRKSLKNRSRSGASFSTKLAHFFKHKIQFILKMVSILKRIAQKIVVLNQIHSKRNQKPKTD